MYQVTAMLRSLSPYQQRRQIFLDRLEQETAQAYEDRTWRETAHYTVDGFLMFPTSQLKKAFENAAIYAKEAMPGKRGATYIKPAKAAVQCLKAPVTAITRETVQGITLAVPADGKSGGGARVPRTFPTLNEWEGETLWHVLDENITPIVFERYLRLAGLLIGLGVWRPEKGGTNGRFEVVKCAVERLTI